MRALILIAPLLLAACATGGIPPGSTTTWTVTGAHDGKPVTLQASARMAGAIDGLSWDGYQFVNNDDHGREMQVALHYGGGECDNPTEAGSQDDAAGPSSSSVVVSASASGSTITTTNHPAFWDHQGETSPGCSSGATNDGTAALASRDTIVKTATLGDGVVQFRVAYTVAVTYPGDAILVAPALYSFAATFPNTYTMVAGKLQPMSGTSTDVRTPTIVASADGAHAIGLVSAVPLPSGAEFYYHEWRQADVAVQACGFNFKGGLTAGRTINAGCDVYFGTLAEVQAAIQARLQAPKAAPRTTRVRQSRPTPRFPSPRKR